MIKVGLSHYIKVKNFIQGDNSLESALEGEACILSHQPCKSHKSILLPWFFLLLIESILIDSQSQLMLKAPAGTHTSHGIVKLKTKEGY